MGIPIEEGRQFVSISRKIFSKGISFNTLVILLGFAYRTANIDNNSTEIKSYEIN